MKLDIVIYSTSPTDWFHTELSFITKTLKQAQNLESVEYTIKHTKLEDVVLKTDSDGDIKFDWEWFKKNYTSQAKGYTVVVLHISRKEKRKHGITVNGTYNNDKDGVMEFWMCADKGQRAAHYRRSEFARVFVHEMCHALARTTGFNNSLVHEYDYTKKDIFAFPKLITLKTPMKWAPYLDEPYFSNITQGFAVPNPLYKKTGHHLGIDHGGKEKKDIPVYMPCDGQITRHENNHPVLGNCAYILSEDGSCAFRMAHLAFLPAKVGKYHAGDKIGVMGTTGLSTGIHLHIDAWRDGIIAVDKLTNRDDILKYCLDPYNLVKENL